MRTRCPISVEQLGEFRPHAVEHLHFKGGGRDAQFLRPGDGVAETPQVVAGDLRAEPIVMLHHEPRLPLEVFVGLPLLQIHGDRPVLGLGVDGFVIPIRPFDQPHPHRRAPLSDPLQQPRQIALRIGKISLNHDSHIGKIAELVLHQHLLEDFDGEVFIRIMFHVHMHVGIALARRPQQRPQSGFYAFRRALRIDGPKLAVKSREFQRDIDAGDGAELIAVDLHVLGPFVDLRGQAFDQIQILLLVGHRFAFAHHGFAEQIQREGKPLPAKFGDGLQDFLDVRSRDKPPGHVAGVVAGIHRDEPAHDGVRLRDVQSQPRRPRQMPCGPPRSIPADGR